MLGWFNAGEIDGYMAWQTGILAFEATTSVGGDSRWFRYAFVHVRGRILGMGSNTDVHEVVHP